MLNLVGNWLGIGFGFVVALAGLLFAVVLLWFFLWLVFGLGAKPEPRTTSRMPWPKTKRKKAGPGGLDEDELTGKDHDITSSEITVSNPSTPDHGTGYHGSHF